MTTLKDIFTKTATHFGVTFENMVSRCRKKEYIIPRSIGSYIAYEYFEFTLEAIGKTIHRDHTSIMAARDRVQDFIDIDMYDTRKNIAALLNKLEYGLITDSVQIADRKKTAFSSIRTVFEKKLTPMSEIIDLIKTMAPLQLREPYANLQTPIPYPTAK